MKHCQHDFTSCLASIKLNCLWGLIIVTKHRFIILNEYKRLNFRRQFYSGNLSHRRGSHFDIHFLNANKVDLEYTKLCNSLANVPNNREASLRSDWLILQSGKSGNHLLYQEKNPYEIFLFSFYLHYKKNACFAF